MNDSEKYDIQMVKRKPVSFEMQHEFNGETTPNLGAGILRRWYIVMLVFFVMCAIGIPLIWFSIEPVYTVTGAIRVAPILPNILTGEADQGEISNYRSFMRTQAELITSNQVLQRVADYLTDENPALFESEAIAPHTGLKQILNMTKTSTEPANILKALVSSGAIRATAAHNTELIKVTMRSKSPEEAKQIVNAFISAYMGVEVSSSAQGQDRKLSVLEDERKVLAEKLQNQREAIRQLAEEYGTTTLASRHDMMLQRVTALLAELTKLEAHKINLEAQVQLLEQSEEQELAPEELLRMRTDYINSDPTVQELIRSIVQMDRDLIVAKNILAPGNPALEQKQSLLDAFQLRLEDKRQEAAENFDKIVSELANESSKKKVLNAQAELEQTIAYEKRLREVLAKEDTQTIEIGRKQLKIEDLQFQLDLDKEIYDTVCRRIRELEMERKRPARISVAYNADLAGVRDKRIKYSAALVFGAFAFGLMLAYLRDKADQSVHTPSDVVKRIGIRIIGTTTSPNTIKPALLPEQIAGDYQNIRANLGLLNNEGIPRRVVVTSPKMREGKTTLAINLARSISESGKKVLLIDGDLRKPDIAGLLSLPKESRRLKDVLCGKTVDHAIYNVPSTSLDVLAPNSNHMIDAYELLASPSAARYINAISQNYEHVIIDTPPVLAFPDTLVWAKIAGAVILSSFAGQTSTSELNEVKQRLAQLNVRVLGTVLSNVRASSSYCRYGSYYYAEGGRSRKDSKQVRRNLLLPMKK